MKKNNNINKNLLMWFGLVLMLMVNFYEPIVEIVYSNEGGPFLTLVEKVSSGFSGNGKVIGLLVLR